MTVELGAPARRHPACSRVAFDHRRPHDLLTRRQGFGGVAGAVEPGLAVEDLRLLGRACRQLLAVEPGRAADRQGRADTQGHDLHGPVERGAVHEGPMVGIGKQFGEIGRIEGAKTVGWNLDADLEGLASEMMLDIALGDRALA